MVMIKLGLRGLLYATGIVVMFPLLVLFRVDPRIDYAEDMVYGLEEP